MTAVPSPRFADPTRCPDCRRPFASSPPAVCATCGLPLTGPLAAELFRVLVRADQVLGTLRTSTPAQAATQPPARSAQAAPAVERPTAAAPAGPAGAPSAPAAPRRGVGVPALLLGLGAVCVLVAALVFLALTWSALGVAGRTLVLFGLTAAAGTGAAVSVRKGLRGAAESLTTVALGLFTFDLAGAWSSGWSPTGSATWFALGASLLVAGASTGAALWSAAASPTPPASAAGGTAPDLATGPRRGWALVVPQLAAAGAYLVAAAAAAELFAPEHTDAGAAVLLLVAIAVSAAHVRFAHHIAKLVILGPVLVAAGTAAFLGFTGLQRTLALSPAGYSEGAVEDGNGEGLNGAHLVAYWAAAWPLLLLAGLLAAAVHVAGRSDRLTVRRRAVGYATAVLGVLFALAIPHVGSGEGLTVTACLTATVFAALCLALARTAKRVASVGLGVASRAAMAVSAVLVVVGVLVPAAFVLGVTAEAALLLADRSTWRPAATRLGAVTVIEPWAVLLAAVAAAVVVTLVAAASTMLPTDRSAVEPAGAAPTKAATRGRPGMLGVPGRAWASTWSSVVAAAAVVAYLGTGVSVAAATGVLFLLAAAGAVSVYVAGELAPAGQAVGGYVGDAVRVLAARLRVVVVAGALVAACVVAWTSVATTFAASVTLTGALAAAVVRVAAAGAPAEERAEERPERRPVGPRAVPSAAARLVARVAVAAQGLLPASAALAGYTGVLLLVGVEGAGRAPGVVAYVLALVFGVAASAPTLADLVATGVAGTTAAGASADLPEDPASSWEVALSGPSAWAVRRVGQVASAVVAVVAFAAALAAAPAAGSLTTAAVLLTAAAVTAAGVGVFWNDRAAGTTGAGLALLATWVRLIDVEVSVVEAYTVPLALLLLGVGIHTLLRPTGTGRGTGAGLGIRTGRAPSTWSTLSPGLLAGLVPSLLLVFDDPVSIRAVILGAVCLALVAVGAVLRAGAPLVHGAWVGLLLVLVELAPYGGALPRWVLIGAAGVALLVAGVRWEALVAAGRSTRAQVAALR